METQSKAVTTSNLDIIVESNPSESRLQELGIKSWPKWGCPPGKYTFRYEAQQTCYLLKGKVKAYPKGSGADEDDDILCVEFGQGDIVTFPKGLCCTWDVTVSVDKYYYFHSSSS
ncbi:hypothetical protein LguiB_035568 [Lonicera macranthoides]